MGRPAKLTPEAQAVIVEAISEGNYYEAAAALAGVNAGTMRRWLEKGETATSGQYRAFRAAVLEAEAQAEAEMVRLWRAQVPDNWQAARDFLARRHPERWGPKERLDVSADLQGTVTFEPTSNPEVVDAGVRFLALVAGGAARRGEDIPGSTGDAGESGMVEDSTAS